MQSIVLSVCTTCLLSSLWLETYRTQHKIKKKLTTNLFKYITEPTPKFYTALQAPPIFAAPLEAVYECLNNNTFAICGETANEHRVV